MEKPKKEHYGWHENEGPHDEPSGWLLEGGEEAYLEALNEWEDSQKTSFQLKSTGDDSATLEFSHGVLSASAYSYQIDSYGDVELSEKETYELYKAMRNYYRLNPIED